MASLSRTSYSGGEVFFECVVVGEQGWYAARVQHEDLVSVRPPPGRLMAEKPREGLTAVHRVQEDSFCPRIDHQSTTFVLGKLLEGVFRRSVRLVDADLTGFVQRPELLNEKRGRPR